MLLRTVKLIQKNHIIFNHNGNDYYQTIDNDNKINIFNQNLMNVFLEQFEETIGKVTYHDITQISVLENHCKEIKNLPNKLKNLNVMSSICTKIELSKEVSENIERITIDKSNITVFPNISNCHNLKICKINHSAITEFYINYELPNSLIELNLQTNLITNTNFSYDKLLNKLKTVKINLSDNHLNYDEFPEKLRLKCNLLRQNTYVHNKINFKNVGTENIRAFIQQANNGPAIVLEHDTRINPLLGPQNVHLSSVNKSILNSVNAMKNYAQENEIFIEKIPKITDSSTNSTCSSSYVYGFFNSFITKHNTNSNINSNINDTSNTSDTCLSILENYCNRDGRFLTYLNENLNLVTVCTMTDMTYKDTFELIWSILYFKYKQKQINLDDVFERISTEIGDSVLLCFTGKYNRLINSMVGIIEGVQVGFSNNEQLQLEFGKIMEKFNSKEYSFEDAYCQAKSILEFVEDGSKESWLVAIHDLRPDDTMIKYKNKQYIKTWDDDILDLSAKELIGYYMEDKIVFLDEL
jgi:hypothetical protein